MTRYAALMLLSLFIVSPVLADKQMGRLFYTPQQRQQIDNQSKPQRPHAIPAPPRDAHYNGYVMRSDGVNTVWVNGEARQVDSSSMRGGQLKLPATPVLKPGQVYDSQGRKVRETYEIAKPEPVPVPVVTPALPTTLPPLANDQDEVSIQGNAVATY